MTFQLRGYQINAKKDTYRYWKDGTGTAPIIVAPTGAGKSVIIASIINDIRRKNPNVRFCMATHVWELVEQNSKRLALFNPELEGDIGIVSGQQGNDHNHPIVCGTIQTLARRLDQMEHNDPFALLIIDEAHLLPVKATSQYRTFIDWARDKNPEMRILGLTATPYRLDSGYLHEGENALFDGVSYDIEIKTLIEHGHLVTPKTRWSGATMNHDLLKIRAGEYTAESQDSAMNMEDMIKDALSQGNNTKADRWLWFFPSVESAEKASEYIAEIQDHRCVCIHGGQTPNHRDMYLHMFRDGHATHCTNVQVMTTGIDIPQINHVVLGFTTKSTNKYVQTIGRGLRPHPHKENCIVLDYGRNAMRHGTLDRLMVQTKEKKDTSVVAARHCKVCGAYMSANEQVCVECGNAFPKRFAKLTFNKRFNGEVLSWLVEPTTAKIDRTLYKTWDGKSGFKTVKIGYYTEHGEWLNEWICPEHPDNHIATRIYRQRWNKTYQCEPPIGAALCVRHLKEQRLQPARLTYARTSGDDYPQILSVEYEEEYQ